MSARADATVLGVRLVLLSVVAAPVALIVGNKFKNDRLTMMYATIATFMTLFFAALCTTFISHDIKRVNNRLHNVSIELANKQKFMLV